MYNNGIHVADPSFEQEEERWGLTMFVSRGGRQECMLTA